MPLKNDDFLLKNGVSFCNLRYIEAGMGFTEAVNKVVHEKLPEGTGGVVAVSPSSLYEPSIIAL